MSTENTNNNSAQESGKTTIKLNRKMRFWNKYKNYIIGAVSLVLVVGIGFTVITMLKKSPSKQNQNNVANQSQQTTQSVSQTEQTTQATTAAPTQAATQAPTVAKVEAAAYKISGEGTSEEYTSRDFFADSVFFGDSVMEGVSYYGYLPDTQVVYNGNMTTDKAKDYVSSVASVNPSKVFVMVGLNDINYGTRDADAITELYSDLVSSIKSSLPNAKVYILSVLPVTKAFESKQNNKISQAKIEALNSALGEKATTMGASFIDVSSAFVDGTGYMGSSYTGNGCNLYNEYYPFMLNGIAGVLK